MKIDALQPDAILSSPRAGPNHGRIGTYATVR
jgi:hypothetical protein